MGILLLQEGWQTSTDKRHTRLRALRGNAGRTGAEFERLYRQSYGFVYGFVRARMASDADAEDIVAETFLKAARSFDSFDPARAKFSTWVITIARNCMVSHFRKVRTTASLKDVPESFVAVDGGQKTIDDRDLALRLLSVLGDEECLVVLLKYQAGLRNVDIAHDLKLNASTVSTILARALSKMRAAAQKAV